MQRNFRLAAGVSLFFVIMTSCSKQGPAGAVGPAGNANVIYSPWTNGFSGTSADWAVPALTQAVLDSSAIQVYMRVDVSQDVFQLPYTPQPFYLIDVLSLGQIELLCDAIDDLSAFSFRYVIVPPGLVATGVSRSYEEMIRQLGIAP